MGAVVTMRPDLVNAVLMGVPFVDVVTTMLDASIPLTTIEVCLVVVLLCVRRSNLQPWTLGHVDVVSRPCGEASPVEHLFLTNEETTNEVLMRVFC